MSKFNKAVDSRCYNGWFNVIHFLSIHLLVFLFRFFCSVEGGGSWMRVTTDALVPMTATAPKARVMDRIMIRRLQLHMVTTREISTLTRRRSDKARRATILRITCKTTVMSR